jgi:hypothetical protein
MTVVDHLGKMVKYLLLSHGEYGQYGRASGPGKTNPLGLACRGRYLYFVAGLRKYRGATATPTL